MRVLELRQIRSSRISWLSVATEVPDSRECVATFLVFGSAEVLSGVRPANLVHIFNRTFGCGRNMYDLWHKYGAALMQESRIEAMPLHNSPTSTLLLLYAPVLLQRRLHSRSATTFLCTLGYSITKEIDEILHQLRARFVGTDVPHEIGVFLGYPLKDVAAFMGHNELPVASQRLWKIYGRSHRSEALADLYQKHHTRIAKQLRAESGISFELWRKEKCCA